MTSAELPEPFPLLSDDVAAGRHELLRQALPEVFTEGGKVDWERLRRALGEAVDPGKERYGLNWPGKAACFTNIQTPSRATLRPVRGESVEFDATGHVIIEGDNLETLKLLQKSYLGAVKMIYIDPPYNTGNDFIYPDNYAENLETYLRYTGQVDADGQKFSTNPETDGRFHSRWLNMMYPRLYLARNLLRDDGVIFISADDGEVSNLRNLCDEIFGEENFVGLFVVNASPSAIDYGHIAKMHDYVLFYAKSMEETVTGQLTEEDKEFKYEDESGPFNIYPLYNGNVAFNPKTRPNLFYPFYLNPLNKIGNDFFEIGLDARDGWVQVYPVVSRKDGIQRVWRWGKDLARQHLNGQIIGYKTEEGEYRIVQKSRHTGKVIRSLQIDKDISTRRGTAEVEELFGEKLFPFPKPVELIRRFVAVCVPDDGIVLDFFAGSGTTAHAVLHQNKLDGVDRKFILVQLPEPTGRTDLPTIADITKERVRRVIKKLNDREADTLELAAKPDRGFKVFKLDTSNFLPWDGHAATDAASLRAQLELHVHHLVPDRSPEDLLYELLLKSGYPLTAPVETLSLAGRTVHSVAGGDLLLCLERELDDGLLRAMAERLPTPARVVCLDEGFAGNDALKTNAVQTMKTRGVTKFQTV